MCEPRNERGVIACPRPVKNGEHTNELATCAASTNREGAADVARETTECFESLTYENPPAEWGVVEHDKRIINEERAKRFSLVSELAL